MVITRGNNSFAKKCEDYFAVLNTKHHAVFLFTQDVEHIWNNIDGETDEVTLYNKLIGNGFDIEKTDLMIFLQHLSSLGVIQTDKYTEDIEAINENNQYDEYIDYCCERELPTVLHIEITNHCNLKCIHCFHDEQNNALSFEALDGLFEQLKESPFVRVTLTGGEIALNKEWKSILHSAGKHGFVTAVLSNLTCFSDDDLKFIAECRPLFVRTSIYGSKAQTHDAVTNIPGSFDKTMHNLIKLQEFGVNVKVACSVMRQNASEAVLLDQLMKEHGIPVEFNYQVFPSRTGTKDVEQLMVSSEQCKALKENGLVQVGGESVCRPGSYRIAIDQNGNIYSCDFMRIPIGNIATDTISQALTSPMLQKIKSEISRYEPPKCGDCQYNSSCFKCPGIIWSLQPFENDCLPIQCIYTKIAK